MRLQMPPSASALTAGTKARDMQMAATTNRKAEYFMTLDANVVQPVTLTMNTVDTRTVDTVDTGTVDTGRWTRTVDTLTVYTAEMDSDTVEMDSDTVEVDTDGRWTRRRRTRDTGGGHGGVGRRDGTRRRRTRKQ